MGLTKKGDKGKTQVIGNKEVWKDDPIMDAIGALDELNSILGLAAAYMKGAEKDEVEKVQQELFSLGTYLATVPTAEAVKEPSLDPEWLEQRAKELSSKHRITSFIVPGGTKQGALLHIARAVSRRAERRIVSALKELEVTGKAVVLQYMNRLSDYLYYLAIEENSKAGVKEKEV
ncbi:MAG: cob(I)yrinic acid a,c-diamide adenosyltransferase [Candidatus Anstonellales archaeon]